MAELLKKKALEHKLILVILALGAGHFFTFCLLALPYRFFPSDDMAYYQHVLAGMADQANLFSHPATYRYVHPIYGYYLLLCRQLWSSFATVSPSVLIFANLLANTVSLTMIVLTCRRVTGSLAWATMAGLIFATSAWTFNYYFFFFYVPFPVALIQTAFTLLIYGTYREKPTPSPLMFITSGVLLALAFWSSPSAAVSVALVLAVSPFIYGAQSKSRRNTGFACIWLALGFLMIFLPYLFISGPAYLSHLQDNLNTMAYQEAFKKLGYLLTPPHLSFFRLLSVYSPIETLLFTALGIAVTISLVRQRHKFDQGLRLCLVLAGFCLAHTVVVDLLPTTKLGRTHFHAYPFVVIFLAVAGQWVFKQNTFGKDPKILGRTIFILVAMSVVFSTALILKTRSTRFAVPEFLEKQLQVTNIYLLKEDPHAVFIRQWLNDPRISFVEARELNQMFRNTEETGHQRMVILGPTGPDSGNSILQSASLSDFTPVIPEGMAERSTYLPYYAYHPPFLFEEETCLALYFSTAKHFPDKSAASIKVFSW